MKALVVDDDRVLADVVAFTLKREGFQILKAFDGESAIRCWQEENPTIIILDVNLPKLDGFAVCEHIRKTSETPIILLTVRGEEEDIVHGLQLGADDYIPKPFSPRQLVARVLAVLRRAGIPTTSALLSAGIINYDPNRREATFGEGHPIPLTPLEGRLLQLLMRNAGHVMTAESLIQDLWGAAGGDRDMLRQVVRRLRKKIEPDPGSPTLIETVPGVGYGLKASKTL